MTRAIHLKTEIPGPKSKAILERKERVVADPLSIYVPVVIAEGRGATITDVDGNTFLDFTGGVGCLNVGHSHPRVVEAAQAQLERFSHTDFTIVPYEVYVELAERLTELAPVRKPAKAAFFNAGTEAVENSVKFARAYTGRPAVIAFEGALPRADDALAVDDVEDASVQGRARAVRAGDLPRAVRRRSTAGLRPTRRSARSSARSRCRSTRSTSRRSSSSRCRARAASFPRRRSSSSACAAICDEHGIVFVVDEVQTGFGRTGRMFAMEHFGIEADLMTVAKSIAAGLPLSGVIGAAEIMDAPGDSAIGGTYVGNPVAQAAALAVLDVIEEENVVERAAQIGETMRTRMLAWQERFPAIGDVRGLGAMLAIELVEDREHEAAGAGPRDGGRRRGGEARPAAPEGGDLLELHPRPLSARRSPTRSSTRRSRSGRRRSKRRSALSRAGTGNGPPVTGDELIDGRYELEELVGSGGNVERLSARATRCSSATSRSRSCTSTTSRTTTTSSGSSARRAPSRSSRTRTSSPSSTAAKTDGRPFIVFEYVDGDTLDELVEREGALPVDEALRDRDRRRARARVRAPARARAP